ncbi:MAG: hypothetical protein WC505_07320 [Patescibacteria group bacterium]
MQPYEKLIMEALEGDTPRKKYEALMALMAIMKQQDDEINYLDRELKVYYDALDSAVRQLRERDGFAFDEEVEATMALDFAGEARGTVVEIVTGEPHGQN